MADSTYDLIETLEVSGSSAQLEITNIPQTYKHLVITLVTNGLTNDRPLFRINNNGGSTNYRSTTLYAQGNGSAGSSYFNQEYIQPIEGQAGDHEAGQVLKVFNYTNTGSNSKSYSLNGGAFAGSVYSYYYGGRLEDSFPMTSLQVLTFGDTFTTGTKLSIWGLL